MDNACAEAVQLDLALRKSIKCVDSLVWRDARSEMYNDFSVFRSIIIDTTNLDLTFFTSLSD